MKIVINDALGGFSISLEAAKFMAKRGHEKAIKEIKEYEDGINGNRELNKLEEKFGVNWYGYFCNDDRTNLDLIVAVEKLGKEANGSYANLKIIEIPDNIEWEISEYDRVETIHEKHRTWN